MKILGKIGIAFLAVALVACGGDVESANLTKIPASEAAQVQKKLSNPGNMDMSRVHTLRLRVDGERLDVVSLTPSTIAKSGSAENEFATVFAFSEDRKSVELFSRDPKTGEGVSTKIPVDNFKPKSKFSFPIVSKDKLKKTTFEVIDYTVLP